MKKLGKIQSSQNGMRINIEGTATFVKIFNKSGNLIRHSRFKKSKDHMNFYGNPGEFIVESDAKIKDLTSENFTNQSKVKIDLKVKKATDEGIKSFSILGIPISATRVEALVKTKVLTNDELKKSISDHYNTLEKKLKAEIITDDIAKDLALGTISATEKIRLKKEVEKVTKEKNRVTKLIGSANKIGDIVNVKTKFTPLTNKKNR